MEDSWNEAVSIMTQPPQILIFIGSLCHTPNRTLVIRLVIDEFLLI